MTDETPGAYDRGSSAPHADDAAASAPGERLPGSDLVERQEALVDEGVEETFPASDPTSVFRIA